MHGPDPAADRVRHLLHHRLGRRLRRRLRGLARDQRQPRRPDDARQQQLQGARDRHHRHADRRCRTCRSSRVTTNATPTTPASGDRPLTVTWTVENLGEATAIGTGGNWADSVYLHDHAGHQRPAARRSGSSAASTRAQLARSARELHADEDVRALARDAGALRHGRRRRDPIRSSTVTESNETNNSRDRRDRGRRRRLRTSSSPRSSAPAQNFSGEKTTVTWTVRNDGAAVWSGTRLWTDAVWISPDPVFGRPRADARLACVHSAARRPRARRELHRQRSRSSFPPGSTGRTSSTSSPTPTDQGKPPPLAGATEVQRGDNDRRRRPTTATRVYEGAADDRQRPARHDRRHLPRAGPEDHRDLAAARAAALRAET